MFSNDNEQMYINFCRKFLLRAMKNSKQRYMRTEKKKRNECILNTKNIFGTEYSQLIIGAVDIDFEEFLKFPENIENENLYIAFQRLSKIEKDVIKYRLEGYKFKEINKFLNIKRETTSGEIFNRALKKMRKAMIKNLSTYRGGHKYGK